MQSSSLPNLYDSWTEPSYEVQVRGTVFLWGSAGITMDIAFAKPLLLHLRNDLFGEEITVGTQVASGAQTTFGTLQPGEFLTIPVNSVVGVVASCALESTVACIIGTPQ